MAYEVARVHGLILSHIQDGEKDSTSRTWPLAHSKYHIQPRSSPDTPLLYDFPSELHQWSESSQSSSLESSTETESDDEDDYIAGLAEQIAHSMLEDDEATTLPGLLDGDLSSEPALKIHAKEGSPQATLSPQSSWSPTSFPASSSDSVSSSKQSSQVSSPPSTPSTLDSNAWDLLNAAAGEVVRLKRNEERRPLPFKQSIYSPVAEAEIMKQCGRLPQKPLSWKAQPDVLSTSSSPSYDVTGRLCSQTTTPKDRSLGVGSGQPSIRSRPRDDRKHPNAPTQQRSLKYDGASWNNKHIRQGNPQKGVPNQKSSRQHNSFGQSRMQGKPSERHAGLQRPAGQGINGGSGMRAVFLGSAGSGRESGGTGVFLPRCIGGGPDHRRKPACSTVLLPSRIVQVLNLNVEDMRGHPAPLSGGPGHSRTDYAGALRNPPHMYMMDLTAGTMKCEGGDVAAFPRKFQSPQVRHSSHLRQNDSIEYSLPTEWIY